MPPTARHGRSAARGAAGCDPRRRQRGGRRAKRIARTRSCGAPACSDGRRQGGIAGAAVTRREFRRPPGISTAGGTGSARAAARRAARRGRCAAASGSRSAPTSKRDRRPARLRGTAIASAPTPPRSRGRRAAASQRFERRPVRTRCRPPPAPAAPPDRGHRQGRRDRLHVVAPAERSGRSTRALRGCPPMMRPPISSTSRAEMVRPRPVPPKRREVEPSACVNGSKIAASRSGAMPMPVSSTANSMLRAPVASPAPPAASRSVTRAALGELHRVAEQVHQHLPHPVRVEPRARAAARRRARRRSRATSAAPPAPPTARSRRGTPRGPRPRARSASGRLRSSRSRGSR